MIFFQLLSLSLLSLGLTYESSQLIIDPLKNLEKSDSLYINFSISGSEFSSINEGLILVRKDQMIQAKYIRFLKNTYGKQHTDDIFIAFYKENRSEYHVRVEWILTDEQFELIEDFMNRLMNFEPDSGFSNAPESYVVLGKEFELVVFDFTRKLREHRIKLKKGLGIM